MRGGKRIEIPAQFSVTRNTLTYETAPGFWVTLQMAALDIAATERANNEAPGSLLARVSRPEPVQIEDSTPADGRAARSITNRDLEAYAHRRIQSEKAYNERSRELGQPTLEEVHADAAAKDEASWQAWREVQRQRSEAEANARTSQLQAQLAAVSEQLNYLQNSVNAQAQQQDPMSYTYYGGYPDYNSYPVFGGFGRSRINHRLMDLPLNVPVGGAFTGFAVPWGATRGIQFPRRNIFVAPGPVLGRGRGGFFGGNKGSFGRHSRFRHR
jgi:hypothetical protein